MTDGAITPRSCLNTLSRDASVLVVTMQQFGMYMRATTRGVLSPSVIALQCVEAISHDVSLLAPDRMRGTADPDPASLMSVPGIA